MRRAVLFLFFLWMLTPSELQAQEVVLPDLRAVAANDLPAWLDSVSQQLPIDFYYPGGTLAKVPFPAGKPLGGELLALLDSLLSPTDLGFQFFQTSSIIIGPAAQLVRPVERGYLDAKAAAAADAAMLAQKPLMRIGSSGKAVDGRPARLTGRVLDAYNGEPLPGATMVLPGADRQALSTADGVFQIEVAAGTYRADVRYLGYETATFRLQVESDGSFELSLAPESRTLNEVLVSDRKDDSNVSSVQMGITRINAEIINATPAFMGEPDLIQYVLTQPGVSQVGEGAAGFNVRGGGIDQNLVLLDGAPVYNPSHVFGLFTAFNTDGVRGATLYKGNMPAQYGGRLSSVLAVDMKEEARQFGFRGNVGPVSSKLTAELPLFDGQTYLMASGRASHADWVLRQFENPDLRQSSAAFHDLHLKLRQQLGKSGSLSLGYYNSSDRFRFGQQFAFDWQNEHLSLQWKQFLSPVLSGQLSASVGSYKAGFADPNPISAEEVGTGLRFANVVQDFYVDMVNGHALQAGVAWHRYEGIPMTASPVPPEQAVGQFLGHEMAIYLSDDFYLGDRLGISMGIRFSFYQQGGPYNRFDFAEGLPRSAANVQGERFFGPGEQVVSYHGWEPRFSASYQIDGQQSVKLSYSRVNQYLHLVSNTTAATPIDFWQASTPYLPPQRADNLSLGYFRNFNRNRWESSVELYVRSFQNLVEYKDFAELLLNPLLEAELLVAEGTAYGAEAQMGKRVGRLTGSLGYHFSRTLRRTPTPFAQEAINNGDWYPANFDQPHQLDMLLNWQMSKRHELGVVYQFRSGRPVPAPVGNFFLGPTAVPLFSERNQFRIPDYHRVDLSYTFTRNRIRTNRFKGSFNLTIYNFLGRRNPYAVFFRRERDLPSNAFKVSVIGSAFPTISYRFQF